MALPEPALGVAHPPRARLDSITGIRFVAAFHVVLFHAFEWYAWPRTLSRNLLATGYVAVSLFFVLSGFILAYTYGGRPGGTIPRRAFYAARFARIYPVYALGLLIAAPVFVHAHITAGKLHTMVPKAAAALTLLHAYVPKWALVWNPPGWSLSVEATFYLLFPLIAPPILRASPRMARAGLVAAWAVAMGMALVYVVVRPDGNVPYETWGATWMDVLRYNPLARLPEFVMGICLGRLHLSASSRAAPASMRFVPEATLVAIVGMLAVSDKIAYPFLHNGLLAPLFALLIVSLTRDTGPLARLLGSRLLVLLGEASYALYILHEPICVLLKNVSSAPDWPGSWPYVITAIAIVIPMSIAVFLFVEMPLRDRLRRVLAGPAK